MPTCNLSPHYSNLCNPQFLASGTVLLLLNTKVKIDTSYFQIWQYWCHLSRVRIVKTNFQLSICQKSEDYNVDLYVWLDSGDCQDKNFCLGLEGLKVMYLLYQIMNKEQTLWPIIASRDIHMVQRQVFLIGGALQQMCTWPVFTKKWYTWKFLPPIHTKTKNYLQPVSC